MNVQRRLSRISSLGLAATFLAMLPLSAMQPSQGPTAQARTDAEDRGRAGCLRCRNPFSVLRMTAGAWVVGALACLATPVSGQGLAMASGDAPPAVPQRPGLPLAGQEAAICPVLQPFEVQEREAPAGVAKADRQRACEAKAERLAQRCNWFYETIGQHSLDDPGASGRDGSLIEQMELLTTFYAAATGYASKDAFPDAAQAPAMARELRDFNRRWHDLHGASATGGPLRALWDEALERVEQVARELDRLGMPAAPVPDARTYRTPDEDSRD